MTQITLKGNIINTAGSLPTIGSTAPEFSLTKSDLTELSLSDFIGKKVVLNIFPSLDTGTCATSVRRFNQEVVKHDNTVVMCISMDLPFAHRRFCAAEGIENVITLSAFRNNGAFAGAYGVKITDSAMKGFFSRSVVVVDESGIVKYTEQVAETTQEPNYEAALASL